MPALSPWLCSESEFSDYERLFHYNSKQLVGLILGARLSEGEKKEQPSIPMFYLKHRCQRSQEM